MSAVSGPACQEGAQVGAYRVLRQIGKGGMGSVWLAEHAMLGRRAAIKVLHPELSSRAEIVTRFFNEARAATSVADPGIVQIFDFGHHSDGSAYIVMELLDGEPLDRRLARHGALGLPEALRIMRQVASTLGAAHARGIVHRDLKPENIFVVRDPEVSGGERAKVLDFGIAKLAGDYAGIKTHTQAVMGTPAYMSPEQCRGAGQVDQRSDVYALGCVLFTLLVGHPPFDAEGIGDIIAMHLREPPPSPSRLRPGLPAGVDRLVLRCLAKDPAQRFAHAGELASALEQLLGVPVQASASGTGPAYTSAAQQTTLSSATVSTVGAARPVGTGRRRAFVALGVVAVGGGIAIAVSRGGDPAPSAQESALARPPDSVVESPPRAEPPQRDVTAELTAQMKDVMARFVGWSREHRGAPCPEVAALGATARDPWGRALQVTCTDQPGDQRIGVISAGPDGVPGTSDDIASWELGRDVTEPVRGTRWVADALHAPPVSPPGKGGARPPVSPAPGAGESRSPGPSKPSPQPREEQVEVDENGIPVKRKY